MDIKTFFEECKRRNNINISIIMISIDGKDVFKYCAEPYQWNVAQLMFSMTKSISSLAIGIASDMGLIKTSDRLIKFFPEHDISNRQDFLSKVTILDALKMSVGIEEDNYKKIIKSQNWSHKYLSQKFSLQPGSHYKYDTFTSHILSAIITQVTSMSMEEFLNKNLFYPMDIYEADWEKSPEGITSGGMGLSLFPKSLMKIANMLINGGIYNEKRIISEDYITLATTSKIVKNIDKEKKYSGYEYGYQFHIDRNKSYRMDGAFGQLCLINQKKKMAIIIFSHNSKTEELLELIDKYIINNNAIITSKIISKERFIPPFKYLHISKKCKKIEKRKYMLDRNELSINEIIFEDKEKYLKISFVDEDNDISEYIVLNDKYYYGCAKFINDVEKRRQNYACVGRRSKNLVELVVYYIGTPYIASYYFIINKEKLDFHFDINTSFTLEKYHIYGHRVF